MYSLFYVTTNQHVEEFAPVRCNKETLSRLVRYFEDVVIENKLSALVIEGRCLDGDPRREGERLGKLAGVARHLYVFSCDTSCPSRSWRIGRALNLTHLEEHVFHQIETGPFVLVMDPRFCALLVSYELPDQGHKSKVTYEMTWTFDANVVFTALEYLMARISVLQRSERSRLEALLKICTPHSSSLRLALSLTTKLTMLMQRQHERESAINSISSAISGTLNLDQILQTAVNEVGRALKARRAALVLLREGTGTPEDIKVYESDEHLNPGMLLPGEGITSENLASENRSRAISQSGSTQVSSKPRAQGADPQARVPGELKLPIKYTDRDIGVLVVDDDTPGRVWEDEEILMVQTVSDQLAVAISHARLFKQVETQAMTDALTGLYNHRHFQDRLDREIKLTDRTGENVSLILLDLDHLKQINDTHGHRAGDACLRHVADLMRTAVREVDICARYGGEEFVIILPKCDLDDALKAAERVREAIASKPVAQVGQVTASIGVATYPYSASSGEELIEVADRAMYLSKAAGRNRVKTLVHKSLAGGKADASDVPAPEMAPS